MLLVSARERSKGQTESPLEIRARCGVARPAFSLNCIRQSQLESCAIEGDSPVAICKKMCRYLEYCFFNLKQETGSYQLLNLNMS